MPTLLLRLEGPMQSWGISSRFVKRETNNYPTKSGIVGILAAAQGIDRSGDISHLASLNIGVRVDQPGRVIRDFQTERPEVGKAFPLTDRYYLSDAKFVAGVEGDESELERIQAALLRPVFPLYLGRRSCSPATRIAQEIVPSPLSQALREAEWIAADSFKKKILQRQSSYSCLIERDLEEGEQATAFVRDLPVSFDMNHRQYALRPVVREMLSFGQATNENKQNHDPMELVMRF